jgi:hypothetical protein
VTTIVGCLIASPFPGHRIMPLERFVNQCPRGDIHLSPPFDRSSHNSTRDDLTVRSLSSDPVPGCCASRHFLKTFNISLLIDALANRGDAPNYLSRRAGRSVSPIPRSFGPTLNPVPRQATAPSPECYRIPTRPRQHRPSIAPKDRERRWHQSPFNAF